MAVPLPRVSFRHRRNRSVTGRKQHEIHNYFDRQLYRWSWLLVASVGAAAIIMGSMVWAAGGEQPLPAVIQDSKAAPFAYFHALISFQGEFTVDRWDDRQMSEKRSALTHFTTQRGCRSASASLQAGWRSAPTRAGNTAKRTSIGSSSDLTARTPTKHKTSGLRLSPQDRRVFSPAARRNG